MRPAAILFDLDGTLTDSIGLIVHCCQATFQHFLGRAIPSEEIAPQIGRSLFSLFDDYDADQRPAMVDFYRALYTQHHDDRVQLFPGIAPVLSALTAQGIPVGIVTSKSDASAARALDGFGLRARLTTLVTCDDTDDHKPHPAPLLLAAQRLRVAPQQCWYIGDAIHDMQAARSAGMRAVGALWGASEPDRLQQEADATLQEPQGLLLLL